MRLFVEINGWRWTTTPNVDDAEHAVLAIAAGEWDEKRMADWLRRFLAGPAN